MKKRKIICLILIIITTFFLIYFYAYKIEPKKLKVKEYRIVNEKFTNELHGYKIAHLSDIHYGTSITKKELDKIIKKINITKPDILIFTGDFVDRKVELTDELTEEIISSFKKLNKDILLYEVKGEDDELVSNYDLLMENLGFNSINNKSIELYLNQEDYILLTGIESLKSGLEYDSLLTEVDNTLSTKDVKPILSLLIMHEPDVLSNIDLSSYDVALAGHTHLGQIRLPLIGGIKYPKWGNKYKETHFTKDNTEVFITSGVGTTRYPLRFNNKPSFNLYRIVSY